MKAITRKRMLSVLIAVCLVGSSVPMSGAQTVYAASEDSLASEKTVEEESAELMTGEQTEETAVEETGNQPEELAQYQTVEITAVSGSAVSGSAITTWSAEDILNSAEGNNGLKLCGDGWSMNNATDEKYFADGYPVAGPNAKAGSVKAQTEGKNAAGTIPDAGCFVTYTAEKDGVLSFYVKTGNNKTFYVVDSNNKVEKLTNTTGASTYDIVTVNVTAGVTYYAYLGGATAQIWQVTFEKTAKTEWTGEELINNGGIDDDGLIVQGDGWSRNDATDNKFFEDGYPVAGPNAKAGGTKAQTNGENANGTIPNGGCYVEYTASEDGTFSVYVKINNKKTFWAVGTDGTQKGVSNTSGSSTYEIVSVDVKAGETYYFYQAGATAQFWRATFKVYQPETSWDEVETPVINSVSVNEDGDFVVNFTAVIDDALGAENVRITMLQDGLEVTTENVTAQKDEVVMSPLSNGSYTFYATAQRVGYPDKRSEVYNYGSYTLAVRKPVIELVQANEDGSVYVDWLNVPEADLYTVEYRKVGDADYIVAAEDLTEASATILGITEEGEYEFCILAERTSDNFVASYVNTYEVSKDYQWHFATIGSAQQTNAEIKDGDTVVQSVSMASQDTAAVKQNVADAVDITNTDMTLTLEGATSGKISDGEEGFSYYYTLINPNTTNFELTATYTITDTSLTPDNQTGFGLIATDMLGINYYGSPDYGHKYFNSISNQFYSAKSKMLGLRVITGYESFDTSSNADVTRTTEEFRYKNTQGDFVVGNEYTFTLRKTDDGFYASLNGEEYPYEDLTILSVQEDGSICVGLMVSRKVTCEISNVKFATSESKGVGSGVEKEEIIKPSLRVYSSSTCGAQEYEYIVETSAAGNLTILGADGEEAYNAAVEENEVVKLMIPVSEGTNEIKATLTPDAEKTYTSYDAVSSKTNVTVKRYFEEGEVIYVSPDGSADNAGTKESPLDINTAVKYAQPGQYLYLLNGTYEGNGVTIARSVCGTSEQPITMVAETPGEVIFKQGLTIIGNYWHIYGIYVYYPSAVGIQISGNYNTIEMCTVEGSLNTGIQISRSSGPDRENGMKYLLWPSYNLVKNCESFDNCDAGRNDADGFAAKLTCGEGNVFYGCIGHNNIDDGWDLFAKAISGEIGQVTIENCIAYDNGWLTYEDTTAEGYSYGEGNGFKLGGNDLKGGHQLINSISFNNGAKGITSNSCPDDVIINCTSFNNNIASGTGYNVGLNKKDTNAMEWKVSGLISYSTTTDIADLIPFSLSSETNYIFNGTASYNSLGEQAKESWFVSTDVTVKPTRNEDGTINMHGLLELNESAPKNAGGRLDVTSDEAKSVYPDVNFKQNGVTTDPTVTPVPTETPEPTKAPEVTETPVPTTAPTATPVPTTKPSSSTSSSSAVTPTPTLVPASVSVVPLKEEKTVQEILAKDENNNDAVIAAVNGGETGNIEVTVDVSTNSELKSGSNVYVYLLDEKAGKLLSIAGGYSYKVNSDLTVDLHVAYDGEYVLLANPAANSVLKSLPAQVWSTIDYPVFYLGGEIGAERELLVHLPKCLERVASLKDETSSEAMGAVTISYASSDESVATVSEDGIVKAIGTGKAEITIKVTFESGKVKTMKRAILVKEPAVRLKVAKTTATAGDVFAYSVKGLGYKTSEIEVSVEDNGVLEIMKDGQIKAVKAGKAVVTAKYGKITVTKEITVK